ncbi:MAG: galactitol-1-phosphate 5-dehydrogenase [Clostridiales Family XIII bacterium]|jgi:L-iditol 2-dehydrogenase|nr:galactitol-1-phosphate 5-dehydrogenase [Clostridiales Family XIII bacterium]
MKAWVLHGINDMKFEDVPEPVPEDGEVLIQVKAAGICASDIQRVFVSGAYHYPIILGHEFSGVTADGRRVGVYPLIPCLSCGPCRSGHYETCSNYGYVGSRRDGAFAEYAATPERNLLALPDEVSFEQAAVFEPAAVALHAVKKVTLRGVAKAAVIGNGAIGQLIGAWLRHYGVSYVEVLGRGDSGSFANYDVCFEAAGSSGAFRRCAELVRPNGEIVLVGNPAADFSMDRKLYWQVLRKQITLRGSWNSAYPADWQRVLEHAGTLCLDSFISHKYEFPELGSAIEMMRAKREKYSKVMVML